jgi:hypothetical protein
VATDAGVVEREGVQSFVIRVHVDAAFKQAGELVAVAGARRLQEVRLDTAGRRSGLLRDD